MAKQTSVASNHLYQSQWWARLAAISEKRDIQAANKPPVQKEQSNFIKTLASLFPPDQGSELISIFVKTN